MKIKQIINNNFVCSVDKNNEDIIVVGKGIGFKKKPGMEIEENNIQNVFSIKKSDKLEQLINHIPLEYFQLVDKIVNYAQSKYQMQLNDNIYIHLLDHIYFAIKQVKQGIVIDNPFINEIKLFCKNEYDVGVYSKNMIDKNYCIQLPEEEVAYIAMHIFEAENNQTSIETTKTIEIMNFITQEIINDYGKDFSQNSVSFQRMIVHVKYFSNRYVLNKEKDNNDTILNNTIKQSFLDEYMCVENISNKLKEKYGREMTASEKNYLILHLRSCKDLNNKKE